MLDPPQQIYGVYDPMRCVRLSLLGLAVLAIACESALAEGWSVRNLWPFGKNQQRQAGSLPDAPTSVQGSRRTKTKAVSWPKVKMPNLWPRKKSDRRFIDKKNLTQQPSTVQRFKGGAQKAWNNTAGRLMPSKDKSQPIPTTTKFKSTWLPTSWFKPINKPNDPKTPAEWIGQPRLEF